jgi:hypothetical protein
VGQRHQGDTVTIAPCKPTSSLAPADRKALARSWLLNGKDLLPPGWLKQRARYEISQDLLKLSM